MRGCPQRGVLSPLLWNAVVDGLLWEFDSQPTHLSAYADDLTALSIMIIDRMVNWALSMGAHLVAVRGLAWSRPRRLCRECPGDAPGWDPD